MATISDERYAQLLTRLDELVRWRPGEPGQYVNPHDHLDRVTASANHIIQGRRGSGKTRLLDELARLHEERADATVIAVGMEDYKQLNYPDILIQVLLAFLAKFRECLNPPIDFLSTRWWTRHIATIAHPLRTLRGRQSAKTLTGRVDTLTTELTDLYSQSEIRTAEYAERLETEDRSRVAGSAKMPLGSADADASRRDAQETSARFRQLEFKREKVERLLPSFKGLLNDVARHFGTRLLLAVDDFYFVRRNDQPAVIDYIHRICKDGAAYLKVATIKHRSNLFRRGDVTEGVVPGHEVQAIDLELSLGQLSSVVRFLDTVWMNVCVEVAVRDPTEMFKGAGFHQLVLASGGVPRDFFGIASLGLSIARERGEDAVGKLRVNEAARAYAEGTKVPEVLGIDAEEEERNLLLLDLLRFARDDKRRNCFHIDVDQLDANPEIRALVDALVDARLLHLITDNTSNARRAGRFAAYLVDVGLYAHPQRRGDRAITEIQFWERDDNGRLQQLSRAPVYPVRTIAQIRTAADALDAEDVKGALLMDDEESHTEDVGFSRQLEMALPTVEDADRTIAGARDATGSGLS